METKMIKIIRWFKRKVYKYTSNIFPIEEKDKNGNVLYYENSNGKWEKYEYDNNNNVIYEIDSDVDWCRYEYDSQNNETYKETKYIIQYRRYNEHNDEIYRKTIFKDGSPCQNWVFTYDYNKKERTVNLNGCEGTFKIFD